MRVLVLELINILLLDFCFAIVNDVLDVFGYFERLDELGQEVRIKEDRFRLGLFQRVFQALFSKRVVSRHYRH